MKDAFMKFWIFCATFVIAFGTLLLILVLHTAKTVRWLYLILSGKSKSNRHAQ